MNPFKKALKGPAPQIGSLIMSGSALVTELLACAGFDFVVVDTEHSLYSMPGLLHQLQAASAARCPAIVRLPGHDADFIKQILDVTGAENLMFPMVDTVDQARALIAACTYPPQGIRGFCRASRATRYNTIPDYVHTASQRLCLIMQVETEQAMNNAVAIGKIPGVDSVFFGLGDLSVIMGVPEGVKDPDFRAYVEDRLARCKAEGIAVGTFMLPTEDAAWFLKAGGSYVSVGADLKSLMDSAKAQLAALRSNPVAGK